ncbi:MAG: hypothetical protein V3R87_03605 [Dehalococcoidia bacterium]
MRQTAFGDVIIESETDDLGSVEALRDAGDEIYAVIRPCEEGSGKFSFEVLHNADGEEIVSSEAIFDSPRAIRAYLQGYVSEVQTD